MKNNRTKLYTVAIVVIIIGAGLFMIKGDSPETITGNAIAINNGEIQEIVLGMKNYNYYPQTVTVQSKKPVQLRLNKTAYGCFRDIVIRGTNVRKYLASPNDILEFSIDEPGTYTFACSMGMGSGKLVVT